MMEDIQEYLKTHTITETLETYHLTWQELINKAEKQEKKPKRKKQHPPIKKYKPLYNKHTDNNRHIYKTYNNKYKITKNNQYYGTYNTLETAQLIRDELEKRNWNKKELDTIQLEKGVIRYIIRQ